jgi:long-chain acyl-CoA synthetase
VREYTVPAEINIPSSANLTDVVFANAQEAPEDVVFARRSGNGWEDITAQQFADDVNQVAAGLAASGIEPGDRVGLMCKTRYEWTLSDYAIWAAGCVTVPIYETSSPEQVGWILGDSGAKAVIVEGKEHADAVAEVHGELPDVANVYTIDNGGLDDLRSAGSSMTAEDMDARRATVTPDSLATIIYTSGTTGRPKGCELTHGNFLFGTTSATGNMEDLFNEKASTLLFLPLAHVFARLIQIGCVNRRVRMGHSADVKNLLDDLQSFQPTFLLSVPRVFEKVYNGSKQKAHAAGKGKIFDAAEATAIAYSEGLDGGGSGIVTKAKHRLFDKLVYSKLRAAMGGQVQYAVSGGAPLGARLGHFFRGIGVTILEGYGLTETTAGATLNLPDAMKVGTVGRPIPGTSVRIADDGEILIKGQHIFQGYWHNEGATKESIEGDGWFHSGDIGELDDDGFLKITGRKKELIVTAGGKNVAPAVLEDRLRAHPLVSQCMVVGDNQPYIACLVTIDQEALPTWAEQNDKKGGIEELKDDEDLHAEIQKAVDHANKAVSKAESIRKFHILPVDFTEEGGQMTPTLKLKRKVVMDQFSDEVDALYS